MERIEMLEKIENLENRVRLIGDEPYFVRMASLTPTQLYINNPTVTQAKKAIALGATGCTNNPSYGWKMWRDEEDGERAREVLKQIRSIVEKSEDMLPMFQRELVRPVQKLFLPLWKASHGMHGYVSIQGDPTREDDPAVIISEARENRSLGDNICIKIPATEAGLEAIEVLVTEGMPVNATEVMSVSQGIDVCEAYMRSSGRSGMRPPLYISFIAGIFDEHLLKVAASNGSNVPLDFVRQAGMAGMRKMHRIMQERGYPGQIISGGARELYHFTEIVGGNVIGTINWNGTVDRLLESNPDVVSRFFNPVSDCVVDVLLEEFEDFHKCYVPGALRREEYEDFGPVVLFRSSFLSAWRNLAEVTEGLV